MSVMLMISGCPYNHDVARYDQPSDNTKRFLSVESPAFTPLAPVTNANIPAKNAGISPKAAAAAIFTPKSTSKYCLYPLLPASRTYVRPAVLHIPC